LFATIYNKGEYDSIDLDVFKEKLRNINKLNKTYPI